MYEPSPDTPSPNHLDSQHSEQVSSTSIKAVVAEGNDENTITAQIENSAIYHNNLEPTDGASAYSMSSTLSNLPPKTDLDDKASHSYGRTQHHFSKNKQEKRNMSSSNVENDPEILNISSSSKYSRVLPSMIAMQSNGARVSYKGHRRNVSNMSGKPLITSDSYSSTSDISECCSDNEDGDGTIRSRQLPHQRPKHSHRSNLSTSNNETRRDGNILQAVNSRHHRQGETSSHIIRIEGEDEANDANSKYNEEEEIPNELLKTFVAAVFLFMAFVATTASLAFVHDRVPFHYDPLPDIILDNIKYQHWGLDASEILLMTLVWTTVIITIFHKHRFIVYRRIFLIGGIHYFYRAITMALTVLPVADKVYREDVCQQQSNQTSAFVMGQRVLKLISGMGLAINGKHVYCGDYIYSGHTMSLVMAYLIIKEYSPRRWILLHYAAMVLAIAGVVTLLIARGHYSIDVVVAYWITTRIWWIFHTLAKNANLKEVDGFGKNHNNHLKNLWWWYIFRWFECNVPVILPHRYNWPIPQKLLKCKPVQYLCLKLQRGKDCASNLRSNGDSNLPTSVDRNKGPHDLSNVATIG